MSFAYSTIKAVRSYVGRFKRLFTNSLEIRNWKTKGRPCPPPHPIKQRILMQYAVRYQLSVFIETGTYLGDMVFALRNQFDRIESVELDKILYQSALVQFAPWRHIRIHYGDSATVLPQILSNLDRPALFWLDGHYSGGITSKGEKNTPILEELKSVLGHPTKSHVILIDDAKDFDGNNDYPSYQDLLFYIKILQPDCAIESKDNIIRITSNF